MIEVRGITKSFGTMVALDDVSFRLDRGEILGFLGPNGAGKSTTMKIITTFLAPDQGQVMVDGIDVLEQPLVQLTQSLPAARTLDPGCQASHQCDGRRVSVSGREQGIDRLLSDRNFHNFT